MDKIKSDYSDINNLGQQKISNLNYLNNHSNIIPDSKNVWQPDVVVLGPGGIKGFLELGAVFALEKEGFFDKVKIFCGVSVGAMISLLIVSGFTIKDIIKIACDMEIFSSTEPFNIEEMILSIFKYTGLVSSSGIRERLENLILRKFGKILTALELYKETGKILITVTYNIDKEKTCYLGPETTPDISIIDAVMMSINIPFIFYRLIYGQDSYIDGALANPYPVDYFDDGKANILGIYISSCYNNISSRTGYAHKVIQCSMEQNRNRIIEHSSSRCHHLELTTSILDMTGLSIQTSDKAKMIKEGLDHANKFIANIRSNNPVNNNQIFEKRFHAPFPINLDI